MVRNTIRFYSEELLVFSIALLPLPSWPKREEVTGEWRKLNNERLNDLYCSPNFVRVIKSRRMRWEGHAARLGERRGAYRALVGEPEGKRPLGTPRNRWDDNIKMDLQEGDVGAWTGLIWLKLGTGGRHL
jgi:hypothetical protein